MKGFVGVTRKSFSKSQKLGEELIFIVTGGLYAEKRNVG